MLSHKKNHILKEICISFSHHKYLLFPFTCSIFIMGQIFFFKSLLPSPLWFLPSRLILIRFPFTLFPLIGFSRSPSAGIINSGNDKEEAIHHHLLSLSFQYYFSSNFLLIPFCTKCENIQFGNWLQIWQESLNPPSSLSSKCSLHSKYQRSDAADVRIEHGNCRV